MLTIYDVMKWAWKGKRIVEIDTETGKMEDITDNINRIDQIPTVDAIPIEWIKKYAEEHRAYIHAFAEMVVCWNERKEE